MTRTLLFCLLLSTQANAEPGTSPVSSGTLDDLSQTARRNHAACGPLAVWYVLGRMGHRADPQALIASAGLTDKGTSIRRIMEMLAEHGCPGRAICTEKGRLTRLPVPSILIVGEGTHCVVYDGLDEDARKAKVFETTNNRVRSVDLNLLRKTWTGEAIIFDQPHPSAYAFGAMLICAMSVIATPVACLVFRRGHGGRTPRTGITLTELSVALAIVGLLLAVALPTIQQARETSRAAHCRSNLHQIATALHSYELHYRVLPPAVVWTPAGEPLGQSIAAPGSIDRVSLGLATPSDPDRVRANWAIAVLPFLEEENLYRAFDLKVPLGDVRNAQARATELATMICPTDAASTAENHFQRSGLAARDQGYARGNYAINGGTNRRCLMRLSRRKLNCKDGVAVDGTDLRRDTSKVWGNGVAGVNRSMRSGEFTGGLSSTVCIEEIRAGVHPLDRRGVWALGFPGSSVTACHGLYGNNGPNGGKDAIQGCSDVVSHVADLEYQGMPCLQSKTDPRLEISERATARSMHVGGVNLLMADGSAHFIADSIDKRTWHNLHNRDHQGPIEF